MVFELKCLQKYNYKNNIKIYVLIFVNQIYYYFCSKFINLKSISTMKKLFTIGLFLLAFVAYAQTPATNQEVKVVDPNGPKIKFETETIDFGDTEKGKDDGMRVFKFTNVGKSPLKLVHVQSTCGCTVPEYSQDEIMPGKSGEIKVKYNMSPGRFSKTINVTTNGDPEKVALRIKGNVIDPNAPAPIQQQQSILSTQQK